MGSFQTSRRPSCRVPKFENPSQIYMGSFQTSRRPSCRVPNLRTPSEIYLGSSQTSRLVEFLRTPPKSIGTPPKLAAGHLVEPPCYSRPLLSQPPAVLSPDYLRTHPQSIWPPSQTGKRAAGHLVEPPGYLRPLLSQPPVVLSPDYLRTPPQSIWPPSQTSRRPSCRALFC